MKISLKRAVINFRPHIGKNQEDSIYRQSTINHEKNRKKRSLRYFVDIPIHLAALAPTDSNFKIISPWHIFFLEQQGLSRKR
jgi:hypothetical protein